MSRPARRPDHEGLWTSCAAGPPLLTIAQGPSDWQCPPRRATPSLPRRPPTHRPPSLAPPGCPDEPHCTCRSIQPDHTQCHATPHPRKWAPPTHESAVFSGTSRVGILRECVTEKKNPPRDTYISLRGGFMGVQSGATGPAAALTPSRVRAARKLAELKVIGSDESGTTLPEASLPV